MWLQGLLVVAMVMLVECLLVWFYVQLAGGCQGSALWLLRCSVLCHVAGEEIVGDRQGVALWFPR